MGEEEGNSSSFFQLLENMIFYINSDINSKIMVYVDMASHCHMLLTGDAMVSHGASQRHADLRH
jgi:hypothetical protein